MEVTRVGTSIDAHCFSCDYETFWVLGAGRADFQTRLDWPVSCSNCRAITTADYKQAPLACKQCNSTEVVKVNDAANTFGDGERVERWENQILTNGHYRCPKCDRFELRFGTYHSGFSSISID